jgi:hypothetical protein
MHTDTHGCGGMVLLIGVHRCSSVFVFSPLHLIAKGYILELSNTDAHRYTRMGDAFVLWWSMIDSH